MITEWRLKNFKSVRAPTTLSFAPITIFCGINSSGKSTIIQSILLISQTLASKVGARAVVLNGDLVKLGQMSDLLSFDSGSQQISIGWTIKSLRSFDPTGAQERLAKQRPRAGSYWQPDSVANIQFGLVGDETQSDHAKQQLDPLLQSFDFATTRAAEPGTSVESAISAKVSRLTTEDYFRKQSALNPIHFPETGTEPTLRLNLDLDNESSHEALYDTVSARIVGCTLRHFMPSRVAIAFDSNKETIERLVTGLLDSRRARLSRAAEVEIPLETRNTLKERLPQNLRDALFSQQLALLPDEKPLTLAEWSSAVSSLNAKSRLELGHLLINIEQQLRQQLEAIRPKPELLEVRTRRLPRDLLVALDHTEMFFSNSVVYLGPLRDEPRALAPIATSTDPTDVGTKGENTAAVLDLHQHRHVTYVPSSAFSQPDPSATELVSRPLREAILDWLNYLGVATNVETQDRGKLGHELRVFPQDDSRHAHDLTHVGVGVSQVLPILVASMLSSSETTVVIEQPELHLHPRVQARLADFFIGLSLAGKQCILETHSEHIVGRMRARIAASSSDQIKNSTCIYFAEKSSGETNYNRVTINEYGAITNWPAGFFDEGQAEAESILRSASKKRQRNKSQTR